MTAEQMIGQILQVLRVHEQRLKENGRVADAPEVESPQAVRQK
jgi:hypothetical protein